VSGGSGFVGSALIDALRAEGYGVFRLVRGSGEGFGEVSWDPVSGEIDRACLQQIDAVVHLAGENVGSGRWTAAKRARILESRVQPTERLARSLAELNRKPRVLVCASGIGYYGDGGAEPVDETAPPGRGFLPEVCTAWEAATAPARDAGIRVVCSRFGIVLGPNGGPLARMLGMFQRGFGCRLGHGKQFMSWIALEDAVRAIVCAIREPRLSGPVNVVSQNPVTNEEFVKTLAQVVARRAFLPAPAFALKLTLGAMAEELLLASTRVVPRRLEDVHFTWHQPTLEATLRAAVTAHR
jgi:uncharacterized protein (TIGR01777 family)